MNTTEAVSAPRVAAVVLGAGSGTRMGADGNKVLLELGGRPVLAHAVRTALAVPEVIRVVLVVRPGEAELVHRALAPHLAEDDEVIVTTGGATRHASETRALEVLRGSIEAGQLDVIAIHDGARPLAPVALWSAVASAAAEHGGGVPHHPLPGLIRRRDCGPVDRLAAVQTPQAFRAPELLSAYDAAARDHSEGTDTAATVQRYHPQVRIAAIPAAPGNLKVTFPGDLETAEALLAASS